MEGFSFPQNLKVRLKYVLRHSVKKKKKSKTKKQKINPSDCYKNWLLCSI